MYDHLELEKVLKEFETEKSKLRELQKETGRRIKALLEFRAGNNRREAGERDAAAIERLERLANLIEEVYQLE